MNLIPIEYEDVLSHQNGVFDADIVIEAYINTKMDYEVSKRPHPEFVSYKPWWGFGLITLKKFWTKPFGWYSWIDTHIGSHQIVFIYLFGRSEPLAVKPTPQVLTTLHLTLTPMEQPNAKEED